MVIFTFTSKTRTRALPLVVEETFVIKIFMASPSIFSGRDAAFEDDSTVMRKSYSVPVATVLPLFATKLKWIVKPCELMSPVPGESRQISATAGPEAAYAGAAIVMAAAGAARAAPLARVRRLIWFSVIGCVLRSGVILRRADSLPAPWARYLSRDRLVGDLGPGPDASVALGRLSVQKPRPDLQCRRG